MARKAAVVSSITLKLSAISEFCFFDISCRTICNLFFFLDARRYVGLCATIKLVALAIFAVDWWLVKRRKHLEYIPSLDGNHVVGGSIISLDKRK